MSFMSVTKAKVQIDRRIVLHFLSCVSILQNNFFFNYPVLEIESSQKVDKFWVAGYVIDGLVVGRFVGQSVIGW